MYSIKLNDDDMVGMWAGPPPDLDGLPRLLQGCYQHALLECRGSGI